MYCTKCGEEIMDEAVICPKCGCMTQNSTAIQKIQTKNNDNISGLKKAAKILMIISCVFMGFWFFSLAWTIPMTVTYSNKIKSNEPIGIGFKVCILLFVNLIAGILLLCDKD